MFMSVCIVVAGKDLHGMKYEPLFDYFVELKGETAFRVLMDEYVTADGGVGIVHQAPGLYVCTYVRVCVRPSVRPCLRVHERVLVYACVWCAGGIGA